MLQSCCIYAVNANLIFKWLRDPRHAPEATPAPGLPAVPRFLQVEVVEGTRGAQTTAAAENRIEIELAGGHMIRISGRYDPEALRRLIRGLTA